MLSVGKKTAYIASAFIILLLVFYLSPYTIVGPGSRGVLMNFGSVQSRILLPGLNFVVPIMQSVEKMDVRVQQVTSVETAASKDLQNVTTHVSVSYHIDPERVNIVYRDIGDNQQVYTKIIEPAVHNSVKSATSRKDALELITQRDAVRDAIEMSLANALQRYNLIVDSVNITDFGFTEEFSRAIEAKQVAQQKAEQAEYELQRIKVEADQKIAEARGETESMKLRQSAITPEILNFNAVQKWNGVLPQVLGGNQAVPFIQIPGR